MRRERRQFTEGYRNMKSKAISGIMLTLLLIGMLTLAFNIQRVKASGTIYIRADGSIEPLTANITTADKVTYTFTDNNYDSIVVQRDNIVVDGAGYTLQGGGVWGSKGIYLSERSNVTIKNMEIKYFDTGIFLSLSSNNTLRDNDLSGNKYNFYVYGWLLSHYIQDIDDSNTVDGKPVYYWVDRRDVAVPLDAGYVGLVSCSNITAQNLNLKNNGQGLLLVSTTNSTITKNNITNNEDGISLRQSTNNSISGNTIEYNYCGIYLRDSSNYNNISENDITANTERGVWLWESSNNTIADNSITNNNDVGIWLWESLSNIISGNNITTNYWTGIRIFWSSHNTISGNTITNNYYGIELGGSSNNTIYHNNFLDNTIQVVGVDSTNVWDDGYPSGGNYWSDHVCTGNPSDGTQPYTIDKRNIDYYPFQDPNGWLLPPPPPGYPLTIYSAPTEVIFTADGISHTTPWSRTYGEDASVSLIMPEIHTIGDTRYYWNQWSDGETSRSRTVTMDTDITLTAQYARAQCDLAVSLIVPPSLPPGGSTILKATVYNGGLSNETDVELQLLIDGSRVADATIPELINGSSHTLNYIWTPTVEGIYNVTAYTPPVPDENITINNIATKMVRSVKEYIFNPVAQIQDPTSEIYMDQLVYEFDSPPIEVGDTFYVDVIGYNISELFAYQVVIVYNASQLECLEAWPDGGGWTDSDWVFYGVDTWGPDWSSYTDTPSAGLNAEFVCDVPMSASDEVTLTDPASEALLARFEFEILAVPEPYEELSCVLNITSSWMAGTFIQSVEDALAFQKRSPYLINSYFGIKGVPPLLSDLDRDGFVTIADISVAAIAFGSFPEHPRWNPIADLNKDGWVDISDIAKIACDFGKTV
jgi:parallel beta-helix repeat protein